MIIPNLSFSGMLIVEDDTPKQLMPSCTDSWYLLGSLPAQKIRMVLIFPPATSNVAGGLTHANKILLTAKDDLNNISDGWYYFINADNPANTARNADNSLLFQTSFPTGRNAKFQFIFCENTFGVLFRMLGNAGRWYEWKIIQSVKL